MCDLLSLPLDSKFHMFCFLIIKQFRVNKISARFDLHKFPMLPLTDNRNPCTPGLFSLWFICVVGSCKNATETYRIFKFSFIFRCSHHNLVSLTQPCLTSYTVKRKFSRRLIFAKFRGKSCTAKTKNHEIFSKFVQSPSVPNDTILVKSAKRPPMFLSFPSKPFAL